MCNAALIQRTLNSYVLTSIVCCSILPWGQTCFDGFSLTHTLFSGQLFSTCHGRKHTQCKRVRGWQQISKVWPTTCTIHTRTPLWSYRLSYKNLSMCRNSQNVWGLGMSTYLLLLLSFIYNATWINIASRDMQLPNNGAYGFDNLSPCRLLGQTEWGTLNFQTSSLLWSQSLNV